MFGPAALSPSGLCGHSKCSPSRKSSCGPVGGVSFRTGWKLNALEWNIVQHCGSGGVVLTLTGLPDSKAAWPLAWVPLLFVT